MRKGPVIAAFVAVIALVAYGSVFIVNEKQQAIVLQFGEVKRTICGSQTGAEVPDTLPDYCDDAGPGLYFKVPLIQNVATYEDRILPLETTEIEVTPQDNRRLAVEAFARWRIRDPKKFRQTERTERQAEISLNGFIDSSLRRVLGEVTSEVVLSPERVALMRQIRDETREKALDRGIEVIDIRISRADFPEENRPNTFERMNAERQREARDERARGDERAREVRARAERQALELVSDAQRQADIIRGEADAERNAIFAEAFGRDPEFFAFYRSLSAYEKALKGSNSTMVISPDSEFFDYLKTDTLGGGQ